MLLATLLGHNPGRAFADDATQPTHAVVYTDGFLAFFSQQTTQPFFDDGLAHLKELGHVGLVWRDDAFTIQIPTADKTIHRTEFGECAPTSTPIRLPEGLAFRAIDHTLLERCEWRPEIENFCGSLENFLAHGFGVCLMRGDEILTEAYAPFVAERVAEIGVVTHEAHRGQGYGVIACTHLIQLCRERGLEPYWSCDADNTGSVRLAQKLGFGHGRPYEIRLYRGTPH